jgi:hypothetical protein
MPRAPGVQITTTPCVAYSTFDFNTSSSSGVEETTFTPQDPTPHVPELPGDQIMTTPCVAYSTFDFTPSSDIEEPTYEVIY